MNTKELVNILEAALLSAGRPLHVSEMYKLFEEDEKPEVGAIEKALKTLENNCTDRAMELNQVASGYRLQVRPLLASRVMRLKNRRTRSISAAVLETITLIAYRQPITRADIEAVRGVPVSHYTMEVLQDKNWVRVVGHKEVAGRPALYGTTDNFLDYFSLKGLEDLPQ